MLVNRAFSIGAALILSLSTISAVRAGSETTGYLVEIKWSDLPGNEGSVAYFNVFFVNRKLAFGITGVTGKNSVVFISQAGGKKCYSQPILGEKNNTRVRGYNKYCFDVRPFGTGSFLITQENFYSSWITQWVPVQSFTKLRMNIFKDNCDVQVLAGGRDYVNHPGIMNYMTSVSEQKCLILRDYK